MRTIRRDSLGSDIREAIRQMRFSFSSARNHLREYGNNTAPYLPRARGNNTYYEYDVGQGRNDRGRARIVGLFAASGELLSCYFTDTHYASWREIVW